MHPRHRPTASAVPISTDSCCSCLFQFGYDCSGKYCMAKTPALASLARTDGAQFGMKAETTSNHAASFALRSTGACQSEATRSLGKAFLTQKMLSPARTSQMSDETPPVRRSKCGTLPLGTSPVSLTNRMIVGSGPHRAKFVSVLSPADFTFTSMNRSPGSREAPRRLPKGHQVVIES